MAVAGQLYFTLCLWKQQKEYYISPLVGCSELEYKESYNFGFLSYFIGRTYNGGVNLKVP
jgi:hypothetical protein